MKAAQICLYAECRAAMPSPMIRLRSATDEKGRWLIKASRPPFFRMPQVEPQVVLPWPDLGDYPVAEPRVERYSAVEVWLAFHSSALLDCGEDAFRWAAIELAEAVFREFRDATLNIRL